jgi:anti-sigma B factor antagonist
MTDGQEFLKLITVADTVFGAARDPDGAIRIGIKGHLLHGNRQEFKQLVLDQLERGERRFILDLRRCGYIDSAGLGVIVSLSKKIHDAQGTLATEGLNEDLVALFHLTKLDDFLTITPMPAKETTDG